MKAKVIMDSGKEYEVEKQDVRYDDFIKCLYNEGKTPIGNKVFAIENSFIVLDDEYKIIINPIHISSIEVIEKW